MSIKFTHSSRDQIFFCTFTCVEWLHLFEMTSFYDAIYKWFNLLISQRHHVVAFVIMPNHLHVLLYLGDSDYVINSVLANGKRFMAYEIVKRLREMDRHDILLLLARKVTAEEKRRKKKHRVFEISSDIKPCYTEKFLLQKLEYIHSNPITEKWHLSEIPEDYVHSSARFYELNELHPELNLTHYQEIM
jgi:REP element-mobilizing transposase RayT